MAAAATACIVGLTVLDTGAGARPAQRTRVATVAPLGSTTAMAPEAAPRSVASLDA